MINAIEYIETFGKDEMAARGALAFLRSQVCYLGGRILPPVNQVGRDCWRVQTFHNADGIDRGDLLPNGCRLSLVPSSLLKACNVT